MNETFEMLKESLPIQRRKLHADDAVFRTQPLLGSVAMITFVDLDPKDVPLTDDVLRRLRDSGL